MKSILEKRGSCEIPDKVMKMAESLEFEYIPYKIAELRF